MVENFLTMVTAERKKFEEQFFQSYFNDAISGEEEPYLRNFFKYGREFILKGGRRLLPISLIKTFQGLASEGDILRHSENIYRVSISIELLHVSSLVLDDIVDKEKLREGKPTFQYNIQNLLKNQFGNKDARLEELVTDASTIYGGNLIANMGSSIILDSNFEKKRKYQAVKLYQRGLQGITRGRLLHEYYKLVPLDQISLESYLILAGLKRGHQTSTAAGLGAVFAKARHSQMAPLMEAMNKIGIIEQLMNDLEGIDGDIRNGQCTILTTIAFQSADEPQKKVLSTVLGKIQADQQEIDQVRSIFNETGAMDFVKFYANSLKNDAYNSLQQVYPGLRQNVMDYYENLLGYIISPNL